MLIALDGIPLTEPKAGIGHYTFELALALARLAPADDFQLVAPEHAPFAAVTDDERASLPANLSLVGAPARGLRLRWWSLGLPLYARERRLALYHGTNFHVPAWRQCPTVLTIHDLSSLLHPEKHREEQVRRARARLPAMARAATRVIADSESVRREVCEHLNVAPERVRAVPLAPRRAFTPVGEGEAREVRRRLGVEENFLLFVGTVEPRKNLVTLARAYAKLLRAGGDAPQLVVAGQKGWLNEELFELIEREGLGARILFTGYVSDETLRALYSSCRVCAYPSLYEGFGLPPLEAMACGAPVVASRIPPLVETLEGAAALVEATDSDALARALAELLADDARRARLADLGRARAASYTWERTARLTREVYEEAIEEWNSARGRASAA